MTSPIVPITTWIPPPIQTNYNPDHTSAADSKLPVMAFKGPHQKALTSRYPGTNIHRTSIPAQSQIPWSTPSPQYSPTEYTNASFIGPNRPPFAQSENVQSVIDSNELGGIKSFYQTQVGGAEKRSLNPMGRTGLSGRGTLGHWGANPAVDALLLRQNPLDASKLEIFLIWRRADQCLALPGGMQEKDELIDALKKEVTEEVGDAISKLIPEKDQTIVYRGYVDDPRNTDNAWMETTAFVLFFNQEEARQMPVKLAPTDTNEVDAAKGGWFDLEPFLNSENTQKLYGSHAQIIRRLWSSPTPPSTEALTCRMNDKHPPKRETPTYQSLFTREVKRFWEFLCCYYFVLILAHLAVEDDFVYGRKTLT